MNIILTTLRGIDVPPFVVGVARGVAEAAALAGLVALGAYVADADAPVALQGYAPVIVAGLRALEGLVDHIDPDKARAP